MLSTAEDFLALVSRLSLISPSYSCSGASTKSYECMLLALHSSFVGLYQSKRFDEYNGAFSRREETLQMPGTGMRGR